MEENNETPRSEKSNEESSSSSGESTDCYSENFDPFKVLYSKNEHVLTSENRVYDNLASFEAALKKSNIQLKKESTHEQQQKTVNNIGNVPPSGSNTFPMPSTSSERRFLPHQMPIQGRGAIKKKHSRNIFTNMQVFEGPLAALGKYVEQKQKIKIFTRKEHGIRGYIEGYLIAFDMHWNLLIGNAKEVWRRRKFKFSTNESVLGTPVENSKRLSKLRITIPKIEVKSLDRKYVQLEREIHQIMIRGEQVVLIHPILEETRESNPS